MENDDFQVQLLEKLDTIIFWLKFSSLESARTFFKKILDTDLKISAYKLTNGENSISQIMSATGIKSTSTLGDWWAEWVQKGIATESKKFKGRKQNIIDLTEIGL